MAKNEIARGKRYTSLQWKGYCRENISGKKSCIEHVEDLANGVTVDRQVQEETVVVEKVIQKRK